MACKWHSAPLGELISYIGKGVAPKYINDGPDATMVLGQKCVRNQALQYEQARFHNSAEKAVNPDKEVRKGDILVNATGVGSAGRVAQVMADPSRQCITDGHVITLRAKDINPFYLGYFVKSKQNTIELMAEGSTGQTEMNRQRLQNEIIVTFPESKDLQKRIAEYGLAIDKKIAVNNQLNDYLSQICDAEFTDFVSNQRDASWHDGTLNELVEIRYGKDHKKLAEGPYPVYGSGGFMRSVEKPLSSGESVLIPRKGSLNNVMYVDEKFWTVDTMFFTIPLKPGAAKYVYQYTKRLDFGTMNSGSAVPSMTTKILNSLVIPIPSDSALVSFNKKLQPFFDLFGKNEEENRRLVSLRDILLPKLMSGEIDVSKVDLTQLTNNHLWVHGHNVPNRYWKERLWKPSLIMFCHRCRTCSIRHSSNIWPKYSESRYCQLRKHPCRRIC